jgi:hypothetical protein
MKPLMGIHSCFAECIHLDLRHMWQRPRSSAAKYSKTTVIETPQSARRKETCPSPDRKEEKTYPPPGYKAGRDISTRGRTGGYSLTVPRRKGGKRCVRLRPGTAQREQAALHTAHLESQSEGLLRSATFLAVPHNNGKAPAQEARSNACLDGGKLDPVNNGPKIIQACLPARPDFNAKESSSLFKAR